MQEVLPGDISWGQGGGLSKVTGLVFVVVLT